MFREQAVSDFLPINCLDWTEHILQTIEPRLDTSANTDNVAKEYAGGLS
jgi:hypothetical protein